ncbi:hypothetical protein JCM8547_008576 [Rhodosporidiobolus lusitaniae]
MAPPTASTSSTSAPVLPRDARLVALLLAAAGAEDCEEGVVRMLVEFAHRYTGDVLSDSLMYAEHARTGSSSTAPVVPSLDDIRLAVQARTEGAQVPKEFLLQLATTVNSIPLPPVPEVYGVRLPPPAQRLTAPNFSIVPRSAPVLDPSTSSSAAAAVGAGGAPALDPALAGAGGEGGSEGGDGLFGDDDEDEDDDEEMEDVTAGIGGSGAMSMSNSLSGGGFGANGAGGFKRKAGDSDEDYDS